MSNKDYSQGTLNEETHAYKVYHNRKHIDTIFYGAHEDPAEVKRSLVNHDGYHPDIKVVKERRKKVTQGVPMKEEHAAIADLITLIAQENFSDATPLTNDLLSARIAGALDGAKQLIAQNLFVPGVDSLSEEIVQEEHESVEDFLKRGGKIKKAAPGKAHGAQKSQKIKVPFRMGKKAV